ncbi:MAG: PilZ domain-containing protein [bacterium]|nr:PilZ domain-containing protein [bacterium]
MTTERRYSPRVALCCAAKVSFANECLACRLVDISASGMALTVASEQTPSSALRIQPTLRNRGRRPAPRGREIWRTTPLQ